MSDCKKCGSSDILTRYIEQGQLIDSSSRRNVENEYISGSEYIFYYKLTAKKEHLHKHCRNCQYNWREDTADDQARL